MKLIFLKQAKSVNNLVASQELSQFLQSWPWSKFQTRLGQAVWRLGVKEQEKLIASAALIKKRVAGFNYFYCPRGPIVSAQADRTAVLNFLFKKISQLAKREKAKFLRFEPTFALPINHWNLKKSLPIQPQQTLVLDLSQSEQDLLAKMKQKTRYNIRLAQKKGLIIRPGTEQDWLAVWQLFQQTKKRDRFHLHNEKYYKAMLDLDSKFLKLMVAVYNKEIVAAGLICFFGNTATYLHGASANQQRQLMAPYLLQWFMIQAAKKRGCRYYDFYGLNQKKWPGVTRFKQGFGGQIIDYPGAFDLIFKGMSYNIYCVARTVRRLL